MDLNLQSERKRTMKSANFKIKNFKERELGNFSFVSGKSIFPATANKGE